MKFFLISDNTDTRMGMRLAGIEGVVVNNEAEAVSALEKAVGDEQVAVILVTEKVVGFCKDRINEIRFNRDTPLITEIPDRHGGSGINSAIEGYIREAIGLKL